nr:MAG TPA: hypothetical protein [Caudoviricetes sp.]
MSVLPGYLPIGRIHNVVPERASRTLDLSFQFSGSGTRK